MNNFLKPGNIMTCTAPAGGVTSGGVYLIGTLFVVATNTVAAGLTFEGDTQGVYTLAKATGEGALVEGQSMFWDFVNLRVSVDPGVGLPIGTVSVAALTGDTTCAIRLHGVPLAGRALNIRKRLTIAQVNAGLTALVPAAPGAAIRLIDAKAVAVGGAVTTVTTVDILATLATVSRKLVSFAQASLTQSAVLRDGGAGAAVLADGASYTANDRNTPITANITGAAITVATNVDFEITYTLE